MDTPPEIDSFPVLGTRMDAPTLADICAAVWAGAAARARVRVVLVGLGAVLRARHEYAVWEALSAADLVVAAGDAAALRRKTRYREPPVVDPPLLLWNLLAAARSDARRVALLAPGDELAPEAGLLRRLWPGLALTAVERGDPCDGDAAGRAVRAINAADPDLLLIGGPSPWKETWMHARRADQQ
jgi:UDP-N-acetyl-D-mannosaminuronic acid transferase (WecB/TagA/CpsF family)